MKLRPDCPSPPDAGIALVAVLWGVLLLSVLAVSFGAGAGREARLARNFLDNAEARAAADAGVYWAVAELLKPREERRVTPNGSTYEIAFADSRLRVTIQDEAGKVDLNVASPALLAGVISAVGADPDSSRRIAAAIADWRDADSLRHLDGAERADYEAAGLSRPKDGQFRLVAELRTVLGVGPGVYESVAPLLTVHSGLNGVDPAVAPAAVLQALPGLDRADVGEVVANQHDADLARATADSLSATAGQFLKQSDGAVHTIRATVVTASGAQFTRTAVVQLLARPDRPYRFLRWDER